MAQRYLVFSRAFRMLRSTTQVVRMPCVCHMYVCVCVDFFFRPTLPPSPSRSEARQYTARFSSWLYSLVHIVGVFYRVQQNAEAACSVVHSATSELQTCSLFYKLRRFNTQVNRL